jgi:hypothetical protein
MARGWESKAIESQQDDARVAKVRAATAPVDPARRALELARARVLADLEGATQAAHRRMLEQALADLDSKLA